MRRATTTLSSFILSSNRLSSAATGRRSLLTTTTSNSPSYSRWRLFSTDSGSAPASAASLGIAGALASIAAIASLSSQGVHAKEPLPADLVPKEVVLYQYEACPFCNKVKAFLDYYDIPYIVVEVNPISKKEIKWSEYKKVPILMVDGEKLVDSSAIIDQLGHKLNPKKMADSPFGNDEEKKWRGWVDNHLVHVLSPNIYRNTSEALESFDYITSNECISLYDSRGKRMDFSKVVIGSS